jgi:pyoverdine/dityrosine biosynthesis protein Dit1
LARQKEYGEAHKV